MELSIAQKVLQIIQILTKNLETKNGSSIWNRCFVISRSRDFAIQQTVTIVSRNVLFIHSIVIHLLDGE